MGFFGSTILLLKTIRGGVYKMKDIKKAIVILKNSEDGDQLTAKELQIVEWGVNGKLNQAGKEKLEEIYQKYN